MKYRTRSRGKEKKVNDALCNAHPTLFARESDILLSTP